VAGRGATSHEPLHPRQRHPLKLAEAALVAEAAAPVSRGATEWPWTSAKNGVEELMTFRTVLITGASSGLGRGLALHYARAGATVHALARRRPELEKLAAEVATADARGRAVPVVVDVADSEALVAAVRDAERAAGGALDLVIANAGVGGATRATAMDWRAVKRMLDVNVSAACVTIAAALPAMVQRGSGTVASVGSLAGFRGLAGSGAYCASKAAVHTFMESIRVDLRGTGVRAVTISPGYVKTEMTAKNEYAMPFLMELDDAVDVIVRAIDRGAPTVSFPLPLAAFVRGIGLLPRGVYEPLAKRIRSR
jgi:short-subunit dehydrogenase